MPTDLAASEREPILGTGSYVVAALVASALLTLPLVSVTWPPITDLPQQAAQIRLLRETLAGDATYRLNPLAPGGLGYAIVAAAWALVGAEDAGRCAYVLVAWLWVGGLALLLAERRREAVLVPLGALFFFSHALYWGFLSFLVGTGLFFLWLVLEQRLRSGRGGLVEPLLLALGAPLLYYAHLFWLVAGALWLLVASVAAGLPRRRLLGRALALLAPALMVLAWIPQIAASGFASATAWSSSRLAPGEWIDRLLGGLKGPVEPVLLAAVLAWTVVAVVQHRAAPRGRLDVPLLAVGCVCLGLAVALPDRFQNTLGFASRWAPVGAALVVAALPPPTLRAGLRWTAPLVLLATLSLATTAAWKRFQALELAGVEASLDALPPEPTLLGLDFYRLSALVKNQPFMHVAAYAQVRHGGTLGFSFASFPTSAVVYRQWQNPPWAPGLEWLPQQILERMDDVEFFDYLLVHVDPAGQAFFELDSRLEPLTAVDRWRLYRVVDAESVSGATATPAPPARGNAQRIELE